MLQQASICDSLAPRGPAGACESCKMDFLWWWARGQLACVGCMPGKRKSNTCMCMLSWAWSGCGLSRRLGKGSTVMGICRPFWA